MIGLKFFNNQAPAYFKNDYIKFTPTSIMTLREGPGRDKFMFDENTRENRSNRLSILIKRKWNDLPLELRKCNCLKTFKTRLKTRLFMEFWWYDYLCFLFFLCLYTCMVFTFVTSYIWSFGNDVLSSQIYWLIPVCTCSYYYCRRAEQTLLCPTGVLLLLRDINKSIVVVVCEKL